MTEFETMEDQMQALETALGGAAGMAQGFNAELTRIHQTFSDTGRNVS